MKSFGNISIRSKFLFAVIITVLAALLIALASIATLSHKLASKDFTEQLSVLVDITAERSQVALAFKDKRTVNKNIQTLAKLTSIDLACMYNVDGELFGQYERSSELHCLESLPTNIDEGNKRADFFVAKKLFVKTRYIGSLLIEANANDVNQRLINFLIYAGLIILFTSIFAYLLAYRLQSALTMPIIKLSDLAKKIGRTNDFTLRAKVFSEDEAGYLAKSFNGLMHDIQESKIQMEELVLELQEKTQQLESHTEIVEGRNKSIKNMFAGASHDLKQPLQAMVLFVNALNAMSDSSQKVLLGKLEQAITNMKSLFENLLDVSKLDNLLGNIQTGPEELKPILDNVFHEFEVLAEDKSLSLKFHARNFLVDSNASMLERIIRNLLSNAIRYTTEGGVLLACRKRKGYACIEVWDTGRGIPKDSLDNIFERFHQVDSEGDGEKQGHGLGLSIVKRLSERLNHTIEVQSIYGKGTVFRVCIPIVKQVEMISAEPPILPIINTSPELLVQKVKLPGNQLTVLLIDDHALILDSTKTLLLSWGMHVTDFSSISEMKSYFENNKSYRCDVVVSDFQLSETENGLDAIAIIKKHVGLNTPALIVTGTEDPELIAMIKESGIRMLKKPVKPAKLRALINHLHTNVDKSLSIK